MAQPVLYLIQIFQKILETEIKHKFSMEIYKKSLKGQQRTVLSFNRNFKKNIWKQNLDCTILALWRLAKVL